MSETLYRKYRPNSFDNFFGNVDIVRALKNSIKGKSLAHAYLFAGSRGLGKTSMARLLARGSECLSLRDGYNPCTKCERCLSIERGSWVDMIEIDAASNRGIDEIRNLRERVGYMPQMGRLKFYIIDEVHMLTREAFNALLKTIEEPPKHVIFILATTELDRVPATIISRCQTYRFKPIVEDEVVERLNEISDSEGINIPSEGLKVISNEAGGSLRDAISILERVSSTYMDEKIDVEGVRRVLGLASQDSLKDFYNLIGSEDLGSALEFMDNLHMEGKSIDIFLKQFATYLQKEAPPHLALSVLDHVYSVLSEFKHEDDRRLLGYIVVGRIFASRFKENSEKTNVKSMDKISMNREKADDKIRGNKGRIQVEEDIKNIDEEKTITNTVKKSPSKGEEINLDAIRSSWGKVCDLVKKSNYSLSFLIRDIDLLSLEKNRLLISNKFGDGFSLEALGTSSNIKAVEEALNSILKTSIEVTLKGEKKLAAKDNIKAKSNNEDKEKPSSNLKGEAKGKNKEDGEDEFTKKIADFFTKGL